MRFKLGEKEYATKRLTDISLKDIVTFNRQAADLGIEERWADVERLGQEVQAVSSKEADEHPSKYLLIAVTVWAARRAAGEDIDFGDAIDVPLSEIVYIPEPSDKKPKKSAGKAKGAKKRPTNSATAADVDPDELEALIPTTSKTTSGTASSG